MLDASRCSNATRLLSRQYFAAMLAMVQPAPVTRSLLAMRVQEPHHPYPGAGSVISLRAAEPDGRVVVASFPMRLPQMHKYSNRDLRSSAAGGRCERATTHEEGASGRQWDGLRAMPSSNALKYGKKRQRGTETTPFAGPLTSP
jgi:hypothetical protein